MKKTFYIPVITFIFLLSSPSCRTVLPPGSAETGRTIFIVITAWNRGDVISPVIDCCKKYNTACIEEINFDNSSTDFLEIRVRYAFTDKKQLNLLAGEFRGRNPC